MLADSGARLVVTDQEGAVQLGQVETAPSLEGVLEPDLTRWRSLAEGVPLSDPVPCRRTT